MTISNGPDRTIWGIPMDTEYPMMGYSFAVDFIVAGIHLGIKPLLVTICSISTDDEPIPNGSVYDYVDRDNQSEFMRSFNTITLLDATNMVDYVKQARKNKLKRCTEKALTLPRGTMKGETTQCIESFTEVAKSLIGTRKETESANKLRDSIKAVVDILNNMEGVEIASPSWVNVPRSSETKPSACFGWLCWRPPGCLGYQTIGEDMVIMSCKYVY